MKRQNQYRVKGNLAFIKLTQGKEAVIDLSDLDRVLQHRWCAAKNTTTFYAVTGSKNEQGKQKTILLHRFVLGTLDEVDHRDFNGLNNRRSNLRFATESQSRTHRRIKHNSKSGFKGVAWNKRARKWQAYITKNSKQIHLGLFLVAEDAALAYDKAAKELHGEFAYLNFPQLERAVKEHTP